MAGDDKQSGISQQDLAEHNQLMLSLKQVVEDLKQEAHDKKLMEEQSGNILKSVQECLSSIKLQIERLKTEQSGFIEARRDRSNNCDQIHNDHEQRLREMPGGLRCRQNEEKVKAIEAKVEKAAPLIRVITIETKVDSFTPLIYKLVGGVTVVALFVPPIVSMIFAYIVKVIKGS